MTLVGHSLLGYSLGALTIPRAWSWRPKLLAFAVLGLLAGGPDWPTPFWGHSQYVVSHSLFVNLGLMAAVAALAAALPRQRAALGGWPLVCAGIAAWLSHLLLDSFYSHGMGVRIFWPLSGASLDLSMPWFDVLQAGIPPEAALRIFAIEFAFYGSLLGLCLLWRARQR
jgi:membrane-bound metal-dependent hydrolase YbcI (DUF457 family)